MCIIRVNQSRPFSSRSWSRSSREIEFGWSRSVRRCESIRRRGGVCVYRYISTRWRLMRFQSVCVKNGRGKRRNAHYAIMCDLRELILYSRKNIRRWTKKKGLYGITMHAVTYGKRCIWIHHARRRRLIKIGHENHNSFVRFERFVRFPKIRFVFDV